ncbi:MAG: haloalkane dehalogenase [Halioglobus sp.]|nr:haloalkane dehalogenase [Halioglobus sp.]|tara:strand:- start:566 stop:1465 length:900 start_codon:yes stop_codon:yes gene_type:complete
MASSEQPHDKRFENVDGKRIAYIETGEGDPLVLLHGNPTSSYLWRNVIPELAGRGRIIVPDLIGQGDSEKLPASDGPDRYSFMSAYRYLDGLLAAIGAHRNVTLVIHDWGSALGFYWAQQHPQAVRGIAYMEGIVCPVTWDDWPADARGIFQGFRSPKGEELCLERNMFVEAVLPSAILRDLSAQEMDHYRAPFSTPEDRQPTLNWPRQIPIDGEPAEMVALVESYGSWLEGSTGLPKLFINAEPGSILVGRQREYCRSWPNQTEVTVKGAHFLQEDSPEEIGRAVAAWLDDLAAQDAG